MEKYKGKYRNESRRLYGWDYSNNGFYFLTIMTYNRACLFGDIKNGKMILNDFGKIATDEWFSSFEMRNELVLDEFILMPNHLHAIVRLDGVGTVNSVGTVGSVGMTKMVETVGTVGIVDSVAMTKTMGSVGWVGSRGSRVVGTHGRASLRVPDNEMVPDNENVPSNKTIPEIKIVPSTKPIPSTKTIPNDISPNEIIPNDKTGNWMNQQNQPFQRKPKSISSFVAGYKSVVLNKIDNLIDERQLPIQKFNRSNPLWQANYYDHIIRDGQAHVRIAEYIRNNPKKWSEKKS